MRILAVDTSANVATVAVTENGRVLGEYYINHGKTHSQKLMPMIKEIMDRLELNCSDIDLFSASIGPGSFTGLRIGVTTIKALAFSVQKPVIGISTLDALAYNIQTKDSLICPIMDARNNQVFTAIYKSEKNSQSRITDYMGIDIGELINTVRDMNCTTVFLGDGVEFHRELLMNELSSICEFPNNNLLLQRAVSVAQLAGIKYAEGIREDCFELSPFYLRKPQAERELEKKQLAVESGQ
jgi:tRNA threonylcarbamoyladenosine biosynthesis protein TsaB